MNVEKCEIGRLVDTICGSHLFFKDNIFHINDLSMEDLKHLQYRVPNFPKKPTGSICAKHRMAFLEDYSNRQKFCCNPFKDHGSKKGLAFLALGICEKFYKACDIIVPSGGKVCKAFYDLIVKKIVDWEQIFRSEGSNVMDEIQSSSSNTPSSQGFVTESQDKLFKEQSLKRLLEAVDLPIPKKQKLSHERLTKQTEKLVESIYEQAVDKVNGVFETNLNVHEIKTLKKHSEDLDEILINIASYYNQQINPSQKIKVLTLLPLHYTYTDLCKHINCSRYLMRKAKEVRETLGVLVDPPKKKFSYFSEEFIDIIENFYRDDDNSRPCASAKEVITIVNRKTNEEEKRAKRFLLYSLKDLYYKYENQNNLKKVPGFSYFAALRPKDYIFAGSPGTHSICVCIEHQNVKLKLLSISKSLDYRVLLDLCVCSVDDKNCMLQNCSNCPNKAAILDYLRSQNLIKSTGSVRYNNWSFIDISRSKDKIKSGSRISLIQKIEEETEFYEGLVEDIWKLREHHFISEIQKYSFTFMKNNLDYDTGLIVMDFAENYTFIAQDSVQAFYFSNVQATLHPFVLYYRSDDGLKIKYASFCVISDHLKHAAYVVHIFQEKVLEIIKARFPHIIKIIYFSDGAPSQYKNKNNISNICHHKEDFGLEVDSYNFFSTSHGKGPCDAIAAVVESKVRTASLQLPPEKQILTPIAMYDFLNENMETTTFLWVNNIECEKRLKTLQKRFDSARRIANTRKYHYFKVIDKNKAEFKITSMSDDSTTQEINMP